MIVAESLVPITVVAQDGNNGHQLSPTFVSVLELEPRVAV